MRLENAVIFEGSGSMKLRLSDELSVDVKLSPQQRDTIESMLFQFYSEKQQNFSQLVGEPLPLLADYSEV